MNTIEWITREEWAKARRHGYASITDGRRYILRLDRKTGATVLVPVQSDAGGLYVEIAHE